MAAEVILGYNQKTVMSLKDLALHYLQGRVTPTKPGVAQISTPNYMKHSWLQLMYTSALKVQYSDKLLETCLHEYLLCVLIRVILADVSA